MGGGKTPRVRPWVVLRAATALCFAALLARTPPGTADEIDLAVDASAAPLQPAVTTGITCLSTAQISFYPVLPQPERVVRIDVLSPFPSREVTLLSSLPLYFESDADEWNGHRWSWFTWSSVPGDFEVMFLDAARSECATARLVIGGAAFAQSNEPAPPADP